MMRGPLKLSETKGRGYSYALLQYSPFDRKPPLPRRWSNRRRVSAMFAVPGKAHSSAPHERARPRQSQATRNSIASRVRRVSELFHKRDVRPPSPGGAQGTRARTSQRRAVSVPVPRSHRSRPVPPFSASRPLSPDSSSRPASPNSRCGPGRRRADRGEAGPRGRGMESSCNDSTWSFFSKLEKPFRDREARSCVPLPDAGRVGRVPYRTISKRRNLLTNETDSVTVVTSMRGLRGDLLMRIGRMAGWGMGWSLPPSHRGLLGARAPGVRFAHTYGRMLSDHRSRSLSRPRCPRRSS